MADFFHPAILSAAPIEGALNIILKAGVEAIRRKSVKMTSYLIFFIDGILSKKPYDFSIGTFRKPQCRGGHVAVEHKDAMRISEALRTKGVICDFRPPDVIRIAPVPLYNKYHEVWQIVQHLKDIIDKKEYASLPKKRKDVS